MKKQDKKKPKGLKKAVKKVLKFKVDPMKPIENKDLTKGD